MKWHPLILAASFVLLLSTGVYGEYYQYTDSEGTVRYTDDPSVIPEEQRSGAQVFESIKSENLPESSQENDVTEEMEPVVPNADETVKDTEGAGAPENPKISEDRGKTELLDAKRDELKQMYSDIEMEKKALGDPPPKNAKSGVKSDYIQKSKELNRKIKEYNKLSNDFDKMVKAFNSQVNAK